MRGRRGGAGCRPSPLERAAIVSIAILGALVVAATSIQFGNPRANSLAQGGPARIALDNLTRVGDWNGSLSPFDALIRAGDPAAVAKTFATVEGVRAAVAPEDWRKQGTALVTVIPTEDGNSPAGRATLDRLRASALKGEVAIGGEAAQGADFLDAVYSNFPLLILLISGLTFLLLARAFRSLMLPLKAVLLNLLSVAASWGLLVLVFQHGFGSGIWGIDADTGDQRRDADRRLRVPLRHLDGLPGVHHQPDARGLRPHRSRRRPPLSRGSGAPGGSSPARRLILGLAFVAFERDSRAPKRRCSRRHSAAGS